MIDNFIRTQRILWLSITASLVFMGVIAFVVTPAGEPAPHFFLGVFTIMAVVALVAASLLRARLLPPTEAAHSMHDPAPASDTAEARGALAGVARAYVVSWALTESVGTFGLICTFLLHRKVYYVGFASVALLFMLLHRPDPDDAAGALRASAKR